MEPFQHEGVWWDPHDPSQRWVGTLRFDGRDGIALTLTVPLEKPALFGAAHAYDRLLGLTPEGKAITLIRCYEVSSHGSLFGAGAPRAIEIHANAVIVGFHADDVDPLLSSASVSFRYLDEWWGRSGLEWDRSVKPPDLAVRYVARDPLLMHDNGMVRVSVRSGISGSVRNRGATLREETRIEIHTSTPRPLSEFQRLVQVCSDFLSVAYLALCETEELELSLPTDPGTAGQSGTFHAVPIYLNRDRRASASIHLLFRFHDIEARAATLFSAWLSRAEDLFDARALYFAGAYGGGFIEGKLLSLTQAVEAFHRRFRPGDHIDRKRFRTEVLKPLLAALPLQTDERVRKAVSDRLNYAYEYSQRDRLESLVREHVAALQVLVADPMAYVPAIIKHRNAFTHFDPKSRKSNSADSVEPERVLLYNFFLRLLLEACFLGSMGFTTDEITALIRRSETYRQLSVRFRPWEISPSAGERSEPTAGSKPRTPAGTS